MYIHTVLRGFPMQVLTEYWVEYYTVGPYWLSVYVSPKFLFYSSVSCFSFGNYTFVLKICESVFVLQVSLFISFKNLIPHISGITWYLSFSFWLTSLSMIISRFSHVAANGIISFSFYGWVRFTTSSSIPVTMNI